MEEGPGNNAGEEKVIVWKVEGNKVQAWSLVFAKVEGNRVL